MPLPYDLLIFDWDGTLMDSAERIAQSFHAAVRDCDLPAIEDSAIRQTIGLGVAEALARLLPARDQAQRAAVALRYREHFMRVSDVPTPLFPGVAAGLRGLAAQGYRLAVATGKSRAGLQAALIMSGTADLFCSTRCADETRSKPDPLMLYEILAQTGVDAARALMVGDTSYDMEMAARAQIDRVAVTYGVHDRAELLVHGPEACVDTFSDFRAWLG